MIDLRKQETFYYSQNSLNTFLQCPKKFRFKYVERLHWKKALPGADLYYENMKVGLDFHLLCERYFSGIACDVPAAVENREQLQTWLKQLKEMIPLKEEHRYLPEYEMRMIKGDVRLQAKYDLIVLKGDGDVEIWDWKTEERQMSMAEVAKKIQTMVYMYLFMENAQGLLRCPIDYEKIKMIYWQPQYGTKRLEVPYSREKHLQYEAEIKNIIQELQVYDFDCPMNRERFEKSCRYCEFQSLCNQEA
ncbi:PD-(D/E)XK nuclease family protein [Geosporobacter ferrireducens]|uniref:PD-(D/E)XK nuclease family protein n=1 Tax=Geosporobacter ferrireducens TaxID=1424294 RepID=UPI00139E35E1|nr:PD-(D/E)XK nuclease family protein [Geosporobacter ferrireducens]MTI54509.1 PD-(D/E)XK nuclease family protein [Geosporobacter ferrireducens]